MATFGHDPSRFVGNIGGTIANIGQQIGGAIAQFPGAVQRDKSVAQQQQMADLNIKKFEDAERQIAQNPAIVFEVGEGYVKLLSAKIEALDVKIRPIAEKWLQDFKQSFLQYKTIGRLEGGGTSQAVTKVQEGFKSYVELIELMDTNAKAPNVQTQEQMLQFFAKEKPGRSFEQIRGLTSFQGTPKALTNFQKASLALEKEKLGMLRDKTDRAGRAKGLTAQQKIDNIFKEKKFSASQKKDLRSFVQTNTLQQNKIKDKMETAEKTIEIFDNGTFLSTEQGSGVKRPGRAGELITQEERDRADAFLKKGNQRIRRLEIMNEQKADDILRSLKPGETFGDPSAQKFSGTEPGEWTVEAIPINKGRIKRLTDQRQFDSFISASGKKHNIPEDLIRSVILQESNFNPKIVGPKTRFGTAKGLMQLIDDTAKDMGVKDVFDPEQNIEGGTKYLRFLLDKFNQNEELALAAYNGGPANVTKHKGIPPFKETKDYVKRVRGYLDYLRDIEPEGISQDLSTRATTDTSVRTNVDPNIQEKINQDIEKAFLDPNETRENRNKVLAGLRAKDPNNSLIEFLILAGRGANLDFDESEDPGEAK